MMELADRQGDNRTLREHLQAVAARGGTTDPRLHETPPEGTEALWACFVQIAGARRSAFSAQPLALTDIEAWTRLTRVTLTPWELGTLLAVDAMSVHRAHAAASKQRRGQ